MREIDEYIRHISTVRRYSERTQAIYRSVLEEFLGYADPSATNPRRLLTVNNIRSYEVWLSDTKGESARTIDLHLSVLSGFCRYLVGRNLLDTNPVKLVPRPKTEKRLPVFYRADAMEQYLSDSAHAASEDELELLLAEVSHAGDRASSASGGISPLAAELYERRLRRLIISMLYNTGMRRAELIGLDRSSFDSVRRIFRVHGKGDKTREVPAVPALCDELQLYFQAAGAVCGGYSASSPLLMTVSGKRLYPVYVDRAVKKELGGAEGITGRKSPHVLRHSLATQLLNDGTDLNSIKELLGHSSLAATQVYTHNSVERLKAVYENAHPRADKNGS